LIREISQKSEDWLPCLEDQATPNHFLPGNYRMYNGEDHYLLPILHTQLDPGKPKLIMEIGLISYVYDPEPVPGSSLQLR
jgi:hypothetical protein